MQDNTHHTAAPVDIHKNQGKLIALGEALIDFLPRETGTALANVTGFEKAPGGAPANVAVCAARLGARAAVITQLGEDGFGDYLYQTMREAGVDVSAIKRTSAAQTGLAFVSLKEEGDREFLFYRSPSADMLLEPEAISDNFFSRDDILHFCSVALAGEPMRRTHRRAIELALYRRMLVSFDVNLRFPLWNDENELRKTVFDFLPGVHLLKTSVDELTFLSGAGHDEGVDFMLKHVPALVVTYGSDGAALYTRNHSLFHAGYATPAVDTTGAGDSFIGSFLASMLALGVKDIPSLDDRTVYAMLERAHAVASLVVATKGAMNAMPDIRQVNHFMRKHASQITRVSKYQ